MSQPPLYKASEVWHWPVRYVWAIPDGPMRLQMDDGEIINTTKEATAVSYYFGGVHRALPKTPVLKEHHLNGQQITKGTELALIGPSIWAAREIYGEEAEIEYLCKIVYQTINRLYNELTVRLRAHVSSNSILDFVEVVEHPEIKKANEEVRPTRQSIDKAYADVWDVLTRKGELVGNTVARMAKSRLVSKGQILQCVSVRDFVTDIDSNIFPMPVMSSYTSRLNTLYESMVESRSASKSLIFSGDYVAKAEYFSRELQLVTSIITRIHKGDCGTKNTIFFKVKTGDLPRIAGSYYVDKNGALVEIASTDRHLINQIIKMRSPIKCQHEDVYGVCETCFGTLSYAIQRRTNVGHFSSSVMNEKLSQTILSTKHLDNMVRTFGFELSDFDRKFIRTSAGVSNQVTNQGDEMETGTVIKLAERFKNKPVRIALAESQAENLPDIEYQDIDRLTPAQITSLTEVNIIFKDNDGFEQSVTVPVSTGSRLSWLTNEALIYIKRVGYKVTSHGTYEIDMSGWDVNTPLFQLPFKNADMVQYLDTVKSFIMATGGGDRKKLNKTMRDYNTPDRALIEFYNLIVQKLPVNIAYLAIILRAQMVRDEQNLDHRLPRPDQEGEISSFRQNMNLRSLGVAFAYQSHLQRLTDMRSFTVTKRPDSPYDTLVLPFPTVNPRD